MPDQLQDPVLDPDALLAKLDDLERQRAGRPAEKELSEDAYRRVGEALTSDRFRADTPSAATVRAPGDLSRPPATVYLHPHRWTAASARKAFVS
jgi:hypothetical protein